MEKVKEGTEEDSSDEDEKSMQQIALNLDNGNLRPLNEI